MSFSGLAFGIRSSFPIKRITFPTQTNSTHLSHTLHVLHMTTYTYTPPVVGVGPPFLPLVRVPTRLRPTYYAFATSAAASSPHSLNFSFLRRRYFFPPKSTMPAAAAAAADDEMKFPIELIDEFDFDRIVSSDGLISICGFGSLLSG